MNTHEPLALDPGQVQHNRDLAGNPVINVGVECPNSDNLRLGPNCKYRSYIIGAATRAGIQPQAVAAIMNAEAGKITVLETRPVLSKGMPVKNKDGSPKTKTVRVNTGEWDPKSASPNSSARGMTQFLDGTWIDMALTPGTFINEKIMGMQLFFINDTGKRRFRLADGHDISATVNELLKYVRKKGNADDEHIQMILNMRFDAESAIHTAVDYAVRNTGALQSNGYQFSSLSDSDKAKIMYMTHHLGPKDGPLFINNKIAEARAKYLLVHQVGATSAASFAKDNDDDYVKAHRDWLNGFVNSHITVKAFACDPDKISNSRSLLEITDNLAAGQKPDA